MPLNLQYLNYIRVKTHSLMDNMKISLVEHKDVSVYIVWQTTYQMKSFNGTVFLNKITYNFVVLQNYAEDVFVYFGEAFLYFGQKLK